LNFPAEIRDAVDPAQNNLARWFSDEVQELKKGSYFIIAKSI
jgi:hypothetical protein